MTREELEAELGGTVQQIENAEAWIKRWTNRADVSERASDLANLYHARDEIRATLDAMQSEDA